MVAAVRDMPDEALERQLVESTPHVHARCAVARFEVDLLQPRPGVKTPAWMSLAITSMRLSRDTSAPVVI